MESSTKKLLNINVSEESQFLGPNSKSPNYKRAGSVAGYTGYFPKSVEPPHILAEPLEKDMIRGYTGHRPHRLNLIGVPFIKYDPQSLKEKNKDLELVPPLISTNSSADNFRAYAKHLDIEERYASAIQVLGDNGQSQQFLVNAIQIKISEKQKSFSAQYLQFRKLFVSLDLDNDGLVNEIEMRLILNSLNFQFDEIQNLALFAYLDRDNDGLVEWEDFIRMLMKDHASAALAASQKSVRY